MIKVSLERVQPGGNNSHMRAVIQRVSRASVSVGCRTQSEIGGGLLVLLGVCKDDAPDDARLLARKIAGMRIFQDAAGKMNLSVSEAGGEVLAVSQFTLAADCRKGRRPSFDPAAAPAEAERLYELFVAQVRAAGLEVRTGVFGANMTVELVNDGPVTFVLDSR